MKCLGPITRWRRTKADVITNTVITLIINTVTVKSIINKVVIKTIININPALTQALKPAAMFDTLSVKITRTLSTIQKILFMDPETEKILYIVEMMEVRNEH